MIIDCHTHLPSSLEDKGDTWKVTSLQSALRYLNHFNITKVVAMFGVGLKGATKDTITERNRIAYERARQFPDTIIPTACVLPKFVKHGLDELKRCRNDYDIRFLGEMTPYISGYKPCSRHFFSLIEQAVRLKMIVMVHCSEDEMSKIARRYPEGKFILPHFAYDCDFRKRLQVISELKNVWMEISGKGVAVMGTIEEAVRIVGENRVLFGSDFTITDPAIYIARVENAFISTTSRQKIYHENFKKLWKWTEE